MGEKLFAIPFSALDYSIQNNEPDAHASADDRPNSYLKSIRIVKGLFCRNASM